MASCSGPGSVNPPSLTAVAVAVTVKKLWRGREGSIATGFLHLAAGYPQLVTGARFLPAARNETPAARVLNL